MNKKKAFKALQNHFKNLKNVKLVDLLKDKIREDNLIFNLDCLSLDLSKNIINTQTIQLFKKLAEECRLKENISAMFTGEKINFTENRAVLHTALRNPNLKELYIDGIDHAPEILKTKEKVASFVTNINNGIIKGSTGKRFRYIVNIGIGGSYLGTQMVYNALKSSIDNDIIIHFVSNVDYANLKDILRQINAEETLFVIASKTFTTQETIINASSAKRWLIERLGEKALSKHFCALSTNLQQVEKFGISKEWFFELWDFIGGRYSLWSSISLPLAIKIGNENFESFLEGANIVDEHLKNTKLEKNIPFLLAIISIWQNNFFNCNSYAILPYDYRLRYFTKFIQQLEMESNGKHINKEGEEVTYNTSPIVFGEVGTDAQHSFFQMIHQGTLTIPCDFIAFKEGDGNNKEHHNTLIANMFAQGEALALGKNKKIVESEFQASGLSPNKITKIAPHKVFKGNKPSNTFLFEKLTPKALGILCAIYEHKIFIQGILWNINSFDQWGVELGKQLTSKILIDITNKIRNPNTSSKSLLENYKIHG